MCAGLVFWDPLSTLGRTCRRMWYGGKITSALKPDGPELKSPPTPWEFVQRPPRLMRGSSSLYSYTQCARYVCTAERAESTQFSLNVKW